MKKEVFCKFCCFYKTDPNFNYPPDKNTGTDLHTICICPNNIDKRYPPKDPKRFISCPSIINRNHDCNWFKNKENVNTYVWDHDRKIPSKYKASGEGTFNINPAGGIEGFYIGKKNLREIISEESSGQSHEIEEIKVQVANHDTLIREIKDEIDSASFVSDKVIQVIEDNELHGGTSKTVP